MAALDSRKPSLRSVEERNILVEKWIGLPKYVLRRLGVRHPSIRKLGLQDALQVGYMTLIRAAELWDESRGVKFSSYAITSIWRKVVREGILDGLIRYPIDFHDTRRRGVEISRFVRPDSRKEPTWLASRSDTPDELEERAVAGSLVQGCLSRLPSSYRRAVQDRLFDGLTFQEIADREGLTKQGAATRYRKGEDLLKRMLRAQLVNKGEVEDG